MRRVMEESLLMHEQEESKRGNGLQPDSNPPPKTEEDYLLECMQKVGIEENKSENKKQAKKIIDATKTIDDLLNM